MLAEHPKITEARDRIDRRFGNLVGISISSARGNELADLLRGETQHPQVYAKTGQFRQFGAQELFIVLRVERHLVVENAEGSALFLGPSGRNDDPNLGKPLGLGRLKPSVPCNDGCVFPY